MPGYHKKFKNSKNDRPDAQLRVAVQRRDCKLAKSLLNNGAQINYSHVRPCNTILHLAVMNNDVEMVTMLLDKGIYCDYLNIEDNNGKTALHLAAECGSDPIVKLLANKGANVNTIDKDNSTPIEKAISTRRNNIFELLVCHGVNVIITLSNGETLLHRAVDSHNASIVKCILENPSFDKNINRHCLTTAIINGDKEIEQHLIKHGFEVEPQCVNNSKFFHAIVKRGYTKFVTNLLTMGADINALRQETTEYTLLHTACINRKLEMARLLIQHDINLNLKDHEEKTAIFYAVKNGGFDIVKLLITNGACVEDDPDLLNFAAHNECSDTVQILLEHGVDINACDSFGNTALHSAFVEQPIELQNDVMYKIELSFIRVLLNKGADVNMPMNDGRTALHLAIQTGNEEIVNTFLEYNSKVNVSDTKGITPLHLAAQTKYSKIVDSLLNKNANITAVSIKGTTALHFATKFGYLDIIKTLLKYESNVKAIDELSSTTLHCAAKYGYLDTINCADGQGSTALLIAVSY